MTTAFNRKGTDPLFQVAATARALRFAAARDAMNRAWNQLGGPRSPLGLSLHRQIQVEGSARDPFEHCAVFRGGTLTLSDDGRRATASAIEEVELSCVGVEWLGPVERRRPLAGVIAVFGPASGILGVRRFPAHGALPAPDADARLASFDLPIVRGGSVQDYWVWVTLVDGAGGSTGSVIDAVADRLGQGIVSATAGASGELAEGLVQRRSFRQSVVDAIIMGGPGGAAGGSSLSSLGRAQIAPPVCLRAHWSTLGTRPAAPRPRRESDGASSIADWTHRIVVAGFAAAAGTQTESQTAMHPGTDDRCALFFRAQTRIEPRSITVEIPGPGPFREAAG